jgi:hypothetical protein
VVHPVEELLQIEIDHEAAAAGHMGPGGKDRVMGAPPRPKAVGRGREVRIEDRHQHLMHRLLDEPVQHRRDAQLPHPFAAGLGDFHPAHQRRSVTTCQQFFLDARPVLREVGLQLRDRHLVDTRRALVRHHPAVGRHHVLAADDHLHQSLVCLRSRG